MTDSGGVLDWGGGWRPVPQGDPLQEQLHRELSAQHPLWAMNPGVFGRCVACDDVVAKLAPGAGEPELAVIHLTWDDPSRAPAWPYFTRVTTPAFVERFLCGGEHL